MGIKNLLFLLNAMSVMFLPFDAGAGTFVGNGGDVVVCRDTKTEKIKSVELLDIYEGRVHFWLTAKKSEYESVQNILSELYERSTYRNTAVPLNGNPLNEFIDNANFIKGTELIDIPDSLHLSFPKNCKVEQVVIQVNPTKKFEKRFTVNKDLWDRLDNLNRAALIFHELLYKNKIEKISDPSLINSRDVRYMVALAISDKVKEAFDSEQEYREFLANDLWIDGLE